MNKCDILLEICDIMSFWEPYFTFFNKNHIKITSWSDLVLGFKYWGLVLLFCTSIHAQNQKKHIYSLDIGIEEGLPAAEISKGFQSEEGYIWAIVSDVGLIRLSGTSIKTYTSDHGWNQNLQNIEQAPDGTIWGLSNLLGEKKKSIHIFDPVTEQAIPIWEYLDAVPFSAKDIDLIQRNRDGTLWVKTYDSRIYEYNGDSLYLWSDFAPQDFGEIHKVNDSLFYGLGFTAYDKIMAVNQRGKRIATYNLPAITESTFVGSFTQKDGKPTVYIECLNRRTNLKYLYQLSPHQIPQKNDSFPDLGYLTYKMSPNYIYKCGKDLVYRYTPDYKLCDSLSISLQIHPILIDKDEGIWHFANRGQFKRYYEGKQWFTKHTYASKATIWHTAVRGITKGVQDDLFFAQGGVLVHLAKDGKVAYLFPPNSDIKLPDFFGVLLQEDKQVLWLADGNYIWNLDPKTLSYNYYLPHPVPELFWQPYEDIQKRILLGSSTGLYYINQEDSTIKAFENHPPELKEASIFAFHENKQGLWLCTSNGLFLLDRTYAVIAHYHSKSATSPLPHDIISHLHEDKDGSFWLASKGGGLLHWDSKRKITQQYTIQEGLIDNTIYAVYADDYGQLWLPSNNGLMCFNKKTKETIYYLKEEGLTHLEFNTISHFKAADGTLYFGGLEGAISFHPKELTAKRSEKPLVICRFTKKDRNDVVYVDNVESLLQSQTILLKPLDKYVEITFTLLDFHNSNHQRYAYKIEGYDKEWQKITDPIIRINTLPYGNYQLRIKAQSAGLPWQEFEFPIQIKVVRPFYLQWWFILSIFLLIVVVGVLIIRWRFSQLRKRKEELEVIVGERTAEIAQQTEELKALDHLKSRFFANISHELRTPLTLILGYTEEMKSKPYGMLKENKVREKLQIIDQNGKSLLGLIEEILELSKLEAKKVELDESPTLLRPFIRRIHSSFETFATTHEIQYRLEYDLPKDWVVALDQSKMEKIINNLIANAFKFTSPNEEIILKLYPAGDMVNIIVADTGIGIDEQDTPHIFERFYQAKFGVPNPAGGTGIGLALCKEFTELMGGKIEVDSQVGKGSTFCVSIPLKMVQDNQTQVDIISIKEKPTIQEVKSENWNSKQQAKRILCVEDNPDMQNFICSLLHPQYDVLRAKNGAEGLELLQTHHENIDLIISDAMMPLMDGFTMMKTIKANDTFCSIPVIMLTARAAEEDKLEALTVGVDDYLIKPFSSQELLIRIQNLLQNYQNRKLWKQELLQAAKNVHKQANTKDKEQPKALVKAEEDHEISQQDLLWMKEVEKEITALIAEQEFNIEQLAKKMLLSKRQFERRVKKVTGLSPAKLVLEIRMQIARDYLEKAKHDSLAAVSLAVGFKTSSYFSKRYQKRFGKKPADYFR